MDTQLCKAKLLNSDEWIEGYYASRKDTTYCFKEDYENHLVKTHHYILRDEMTDWGLPNELRAYEIDINTLCRCTGSHDKNGKLIYENDILNGELYNVVSYGNGENEFLGMNVGWYVQRDNFESWCELNDLDYYEVTGNIYDITEQLKVGGKNE